MPISLFLITTYISIEIAEQTLVIFSSPAIYNNIQNLSVNNDLSSDDSAILFNLTTNINKSVSRPIKVKLYHKAKWGSINSSLSK